MRIVMIDFRPDKDTLSKVYDFKFEKPLNRFIFSACNPARFPQSCCDYVN